MRPPWDFALFAAVAVAATFAVARLARPSRSGRLALLALAVALLGGGLYVESAGRTATGEIERLVSAMAPTYARELERLGHADLPLDAEPADPRYLELIEAEKRWLAANPEIADIYTFRRLSDGRIVLLVDSETDYDRDGRFEGARESRTAIGEPVAQPATSLIAAFEGRPSFESRLVTDRWGTWVSRFEPLRDRAGAIEAVLGVDFEERLFRDAVMSERLRAIAVVAALLAVALTGIGSVARLRRSADELASRNSELARARDVALAASQTKSRFLANVSHELRTPLHVFLGMNELLLESPLDERQHKFAETARRAAEGLLGMVDDLLDYAQLEGGKLSSDVFVFDLAELVAAAADTHRSSAEAKGLTLVAEIDASASVRVLSDPRRVRQILRHLLANAIKFTEKGEIRVRAGVRPLAGADGREAVIEVIDTGIGVAPDRRAEVFDSFSQIDPSATRRHGGTGIGLALSKALSEKLGGQLELDSETGRGSTFRLVFPLRELPGPTAG
jgi:signal transduction histidine kinase